MKFLATLIFGFLITLQSLDLKDIRTAYVNAAKDELNAELFYKSLSTISKSDKIELVAYKGAAIAINSKYLKAVKVKKETFIEGVTLIEYAIEKEPDNIELRLIRLSIQENTPKLLKYKEAIETDKNFILNQLKSIKTGTLKNVIIDYISQSKVFTNQEKTVVLG